MSGTIELTKLQSRLLRRIYNQALKDFSFGRQAGWIHLGDHPSGILELLENNGLIHKSREGVELYRITVWGIIWLAKNEKVES